MSSLVDHLKRAEYQYYEDPIEVIALIDRSGDDAIRFEGIHLILIKDARCSMPLWIAELLEEKGIVKIPFDDSLLLEELDSIQSKESGNMLSKIDKNLYRRVRKELELLDRSEHRTSKMKYRSINDYYNQILKIRSKKVVSMFSFQNITENILLRDLPVEEKWLLHRFTEVYQEWKSKIGESIKLEILNESKPDSSGIYSESLVIFKPKLIEIELKKEIELELTLNMNNKKETINLDYEDERIPIPSYFEHGEGQDSQKQTPIKTTIIPIWLNHLLIQRGYGNSPPLDAVDSSSIIIENKSLKVLTNAYSINSSETRDLELINFFAMESYIEEIETEELEGTVQIIQRGKVIDKVDFKIIIPLQMNQMDRLPLWMAEILEEKGLIVIPEKIIESNPRNFTTELNENLQGKGSHNFSSSYYRWVRREIEDLRSYSNDAELIKLNRLESYLDALLRRKAREIVSKFPFDQDNILSSYTRESRWLVQRFIEIVEEWKGMVLT